MEAEEGRLVRADALSNQFCKLLGAEPSLLQNTAQQRRWNVARVHRYRDARFCSRRVKQPYVAARLVMHVKPRVQQRTDNLFRL